MRTSHFARPASLSARSSAQIISCAVEALDPRLLFAANYYVDYVGGLDTNNGTSTTTAFKHAPGDSAATNNALSAPLAAGDVVHFKGGVVYRGKISAKASGTTGNPIIYDGNSDGAWGTGDAIIDGRVALTGWTQAASATEVDGNANWQNIYWTWVPATTSLTQAAVFEDGNALFLAKGPNSSDPFWDENVADFATSDARTTSSITDATFLNQSDPNYWAGPTQVVVRGGNNNLYYTPVTGFDPATDTISFATLPAALDPEFSMLNSFKVMDVPGEYVLRTDRTDGAGNVKMYIMPLTPGITGKSFEVAKQTNLFFLGNKSNITIKGFTLQGSAYSTRGAVATQTASANSGLTITDNVIRQSAGMGIYLNGTSDVNVSNNTVYENIDRAVFATGGNNVKFDHNVVYRNKATGVEMYGTTNSEITNNVVTDQKGQHANGITVYIGANNVLVRGNVVTGGNVAFTTQASDNITVAYNVFTSTLGAPSFAAWPSSTATSGLYMYNNVMLGGYATINTTNKTNIISKNNIMAGSNVVYRGGTASNNIYTYNMYQNDPYGGATGSILQTDLTQIFVDPAAGDYRLKTASPAIDAGATISGLTSDIVGTAVPQGGATDIGAYEKIVAVPATLTPTDDANVRADMYNGGNYGTSTLLDVRQHTSPTDGRNRQTYIKFDLSSVSTIDNGKIRLYQPSNTFTGTTGIGVYAVPDTSWSESTLTWLNKPAVSGAALDTETITQGSASGTWYEWDVTSYLQSEKAAGHNVVSFAFLANSYVDVVRFSSKEATGTTNDPQLVLNSTPLNLASPANPSRPVKTIKRSDITGAVRNAALQPFRAAGFSVAPLRNVNIRVKDLGGSTLGEVDGDTIYIDDDAAGQGWFIDRTPFRSEEFESVASGLFAKPRSAAAGRVDLVSVLSHEFGHLLGLEHSPDASTIMGSTLTFGQRRIELE